MSEIPEVHHELDIAELDITHVFRDFDQHRVGFIVQGNLAPLYVYVSDEQAGELSASFSQWLEEEGPTQGPLVFIEEE